MSLKIDTILSQIDIGAYALPVFQRGYVWNRDQERKLMYSLYRGYPVGELLVWNTTTDASRRGFPTFCNCYSGSKCGN